MKSLTFSAPSMLLMSSLNTHWFMLQLEVVGLLMI